MNLTQNKVQNKMKIIMISFIVIFATIQVSMVNIENSKGKNRNNGINTSKVSLKPKKSEILSGNVSTNGLCNPTCDDPW